MKKNVFFMDAESKDTVNNKIEFVEIEYHLHKKTNSGKLIEREEIISLDAKTKKLIIKQVYSSSHTIKEYFIPNEIDSLLCQFEKAVVNSDKQKKSQYPIYKMHIKYKNSKVFELSAGFNRSELPDFWEEFAYEISDIIENHGIYGDLLDFDLYGKGVRKGEYIFCSIIFENNSIPYYYITDDNSIEVDDEVLVPFGKVEKIGRISNIEYFKEQNVPVPLDRAKKIIKKINKTVRFPEI